MSLVATPMAEKDKADEECTYASVKIDDQVLPLAKAAAALAGQKVQDYLSDVINQAASKALDKKPVRRRGAKKR